MKNENQKLDLNKFEVLSEDNNGALVGGFSAVTETRSENNLFNTETNNCHGGNCAKGCSQQK
jgi:hypothetical protein